MSGCLFFLIALGCADKGPISATPKTQSTTASPATELPPPKTPSSPQVVDPVVDATQTAALKLAEDSTLELEGFVADLPQTERVAQTKQRLVYAASYTAGKRRSPWRAVQAKDFLALEKEMASESAAQDPNSTTLSPVLQERLKVAVKLTFSQDAFERSAAYELIERTLRHLPKVDHRQYFLAHVPPYEIAERADERFHQIEPLSLRPFARILPFLWRVALEDEDGVVRGQALKGLERWYVDHPKVDAAPLVRAINAKWSDPVTQASLFSLAGLLAVPEVLAWCRDGLDGQGDALSCRVGLSRLRTSDAFDVLLKWVVKRSRDKRLQGPNNYGFREDFAHLAPYADLPYAKARYYALFDTVLGQVARSGFATGMIARRSIFLADTEKALEILRRHHAKYQTLWTRVRMSPDRKFLLEEFPKVIAAFEGRAGATPNEPKSQ